MTQHENNHSAHEELHAIISGYVQGVGFRYFVTHKASALQLRGYVRNTPTGNVEVVAQGSHTDLERLLYHLRAGPSAAEVEDVQVHWRTPTEHFSGFHIRY